MADIKEKSNAGTNTSVATSSTSTFRSRRVNLSPGRPRRLVLKETVPTALVSPQTVQVKVQPPVVYGYHRSSPVTSTPFIRTSRLGAEFGGSDLNCNNSQSCYAPVHDTTKLSAPNSLNNLHQDDYGILSSSSNISLYNTDSCLIPAVSDDRLESLEQRMRFLEARLYEYDTGGRQVRPNNNINHNTSTHSSCTNLLNTSAPAISSQNRIHEIDVLKDKIRKLQVELDNERRLRDKQLKQSSKELLWKVDENQTLRCRVRELETENRMWKDRFQAYNASVYYQPSAVDEEKAALQETINDLKSKIDELENLSKKSAEVFPEDQYVPIEKYRGLKAKSKKLLTEKCRSLRTEILEKESLKVQMHLQNSELSELRKAVYDFNGSKCDCANNNNNNDGSTKIREEILKAAHNCRFSANCLLAVCADVAAKKTPDYDQILGLKSLNGVSISDHKMDQKVFENLTLYYEQLFSEMQNLHGDLTRMQRLMVDYYTNELVDTIDCRLQ